MSILALKFFWHATALILNPAYNHILCKFLYFQKKSHGEAGADSVICCRSHLSFDF